MYVNVVLKVLLGRQLMVPASAVLQSGMCQVVFVNHGDGNLEPRQVMTGARVGDEFIVTKGLKPKESIVTSANFLIDSESQLQAASGSYVPPPPGAGGAAVNGSQPSNGRRKRAPNSHRTLSASQRKQFSASSRRDEQQSDHWRQVVAHFYMPAMSAMGMAVMTTRTVLTVKEWTVRSQRRAGSGGTSQVTKRPRKMGRWSSTKHFTVNAEGRNVIMISRIIYWCANNRFLVFTSVLLLVLAGIWSSKHIPLDAFPDISDVQAIIRHSLGR